MNQPLNEIVRAGRKAKGLTQEQLAQSLYVSRQTISHWENGRARPDYELLKRLAEALEIPLTTLLGVEDEGAQGTESEPVCEAPMTVEETAAEEPLPQPRKSLRWLTVVCAVLALAGMIIGVWRNLRPAEPPIPAVWFQQEESYEADCAKVSMYVLQDPVTPVYSDAEKTYLWEYDLYLREEHGVSFTITRLQCHYYHPDGGYHILETSGERFCNGQNVLRANSVRKFTFEERSGQTYLGVGLLLEGVDANGSDLSFRCYLPFS